MAVIDGWVISCELAFRWMSLDLTDDKSTLVQVMAWCRQAKAITWAYVDRDLFRHVALLGPNELISMNVVLWYHPLTVPTYFRVT